MTFNKHIPTSKIKSRSLIKQEILEDLPWLIITYGMTINLLIFFSNLAAFLVLEGYFDPLAEMLSKW